MPIVEAIKAHNASAKSLTLIPDQLEDKKDSYSPFFPPQFEPPPLSSSTSDDRPTKNNRVRVSIIFDIGQDLPRIFICLRSMIFTLPVKKTLGRIIARFIHKLVPQNNIGKEIRARVMRCSEGVQGQRNLLTWFSRK
jgi:hypothetical protein